ncbi:MAG TPA: dTDP-glucose 4,6-dehydratase [Chloroflexi bacterium]|nr:dTDP-glucose 4,6-dehydratase [Chloroflexota bacterium]
MKNLLVTGGAGFIGANFTQFMLNTYSDVTVTVFDKLTYAGNLENLASVSDDLRYQFYQGDICDAEAVDKAMRQFNIDAIVNFAAETHVDRSLMEPGSFIQTDVYGTFVLLEAAKNFGVERYHQISTDEVYGEVMTGRSTENDNLEPRSPYSASKAGGDLLCLSYFTSFDLPVTITRGSNNIGPYQYPEKVVPLFVTNAIDNKALPIYGDGSQMRDYQHVQDHCAGIDMVLRKGQVGEIYNLGTGEETTNLTMAQSILALLGKPESLLQPVTDRPGHDRRYAIDVSKAGALEWENRYDFAAAIDATVKWYVDNEDWWRKIKSGAAYKEYYAKNYSRR